MLLLPLVCDFLLLDHDLVRAFLGMPVLFFLLQELVFKLGYLDVAFVVELVDSVVVDHFEPVQLRYGCVLLITDGVDKFTQPFVFYEVPIVVAHVAVELDLELMHLDLRILALVPHGLDLFSLLLALVDEPSIVLRVLQLSLIDLLAIVLILLVCVLLEITPLVNHFVQLFLQAISFNLLRLLRVECV